MYALPRPIMGDEKVGQVQPFLHFFQRVNYLGLIETSSADTGSSHTINSGSTAIARAIPIFGAVLLKIHEDNGMRVRY